ncbi:MULTISPECIES: tRNA lysidine(34) synthetase TilS [unclassified Olleya]|jgi:tRNA(Ile)-lysidine synthase|uniref:tRNA lysidine(34) synthetase TilS n=1 Tax=unclassified Olleya TaxID=2615019 RepID=UPI0011A55969|nr:tRNA lysidine(34) synthetase TilS [Olleya sp. Hel_I_94]TVZ46719.1 tRNA(Ile)-lysidine synthase [Olleya sp. Hel_I_94]
MPYNLKEHFQNHINNTLPFLRISKLLLAISGGLDSVILTHLCKKSGLDITLAHCNFNLRGIESDGDEKFVTDLADSLELEVFTESFDTKAYAESNKESIQMAARTLRYDWFQDLAENLDFDYILTAHHADDNLETFLINLTRGTGLEGLKGIPEINENIVRPLLPFSRETIEDFALSNQILWREDSSNASTKYLRNKLRHDVIPVLKELNNNVLTNFKNTLNNLNDTADIVEESVQAVLIRAIIDIDDAQISYKISEFIKVNNPKAYLYEVFKDYGFTQWTDIVNLLTAQSGRQVFSATHQLLKNRETLILSELKNEDSLHQNEASVIINNFENEVNVLSGALTFETVANIEKSDSATIYIDKETLKLPLTVRHWQEGDYFYPLGMQGKKKLSKYFKDQKLSLIDKEKVLLLCSQDKIVWVINHRADDRFKVTNQTKSILKIKLS